MKKILAILAAVVAVCACSQDAKVRRVVEKAVKAELAVPSSFKFVALDKDRDITVRNAMSVAITQAMDLYSYDLALRAQVVDSIARVCDRLEPVADSVLISVYRLTYRADIPGKGRDFPEEAFVAVRPPAKLYGVVDSPSDLLNSCWWMVPELVQTTEYATELMRGR